MRANVLCVFHQIDVVFIVGVKESMVHKATNGEFIIMVIVVGVVTATQELERPQNSELTK